MGARATARRSARNKIFIGTGTAKRRDRAVRARRPRLSGFRLTAFIFKFAPRRRARAAQRGAPRALAPRSAAAAARTAAPSAARRRRRPPATTPPRARRRAPRTRLTKSRRRRPAKDKQHGLEERALPAPARRPEPARLPRPRRRPDARRPRRHHPQGRQGAEDLRELPVSVHGREGRRLEGKEAPLQGKSFHRVVPDFLLQGGMWSTPTPWTR